jgi:hypothetical protein
MEKERGKERARERDDCLCVLDEQVGYAGWERGRERERKQGEKKREGDRKEAVREINRERE